MNKITYLNNEPFKEKPCLECGRTLRQTRIRMGRNGLKAYRIWVHKDTRKKQCYDITKDSPYMSMPVNHKEICKCHDCERTRAYNKDILFNKLDEENKQKNR